jgi:hypothetical protein
MEIALVRASIEDIMPSIALPRSLKESVCRVWSGPRPGGLTLRLRDSWGTEVRGWSSLAKLITYRGFRT